ncbi:MAG: phosphopantothenoylcysteine decarboxylase [Planctomycetota bacterium]
MTRRPPKLLITAGPSREYFDDVRFLSNGSSGAQGIALAEAARDAGLAVELLLGPTALAPPDGVTVNRFEGAEELDRLAREAWPDTDAFVATAAVCDYRPAERIDGKRKKEPGDWTVRLVRNPDVLASRGAEKGDRTVIGFALESTPIEEARGEAHRKLESKGLDVIILNGPANMGRDAGTFEWIEAARPPAPPAVTSLGDVTKRDLARRIVEYLVERHPIG